MLLRPISPFGNWLRLLFLSESAVLLFGLLVSQRLARRLARPIHNLTETASVLAAGDLSARAQADVPGRGGALAVAFNRMAAEVAASHATLEQHVAERTAELTRDIAEHERTQENLRAVRDAAEPANRAKSDFLANMSHEIRTPMNAIIGMTELVLDTDLISEAARLPDDGSVESAESLLSIINDILDFSKIEAGKLELEPIDFDLREDVGDTLKSLAHAGRRARAWSWPGSVDSGRARRAGRRSRGCGRSWSTWSATRSSSPTRARSRRSTWSSPRRRGEDRDCSFAFATPASGSRPTS